MVLDSNWWIVLQRTKSTFFTSSNALKMIWWTTDEMSVSWRYDAVSFGFIASTPGM